MYYTDFHLTGPPFENTLDPRFLYLTEVHEEILASLLYFVRERKGFALICGGTGTGKTMLVKSFLSKLPDHVQIFAILNPDVEYRDILSFIARGLGIEGSRRSCLDLVEDVRKALIEGDQLGRRYLLVVDEAHLLSDSNLELIRLLSNLEDHKYKYLQILFVGKHELRARLMRPHLRQLRQRIELSRTITPLSSEETRSYIDHRLSVVGGSYESCFKPGCAGMIHRIAGGVPRSINQVCDTALVISKGEGLSRVDVKVLRKVEKSLRSELSYTLRSVGAGGRLANVWSFGRRAAHVGSFVVMLFMLGVMGHEGLLGSKIYKLLNRTPTAIEPSKTVPIHQSDKVSADGKKILIQKVPKEEARLQDALQKEDSSMTPAKGAEAVAGSGDSSSSSPMSAHTETPQQGIAKPVASPVVPLPAQDESAGTEEGDALVTSQMHSWNTTMPADKATEVADTNRTEAQIAIVENLLGGPILPKPHPPSQVKVQKGDTIIKIARRWYPENPTAACKAILRANPSIEDADHIRTGQIIRLPEGGA